MIERLPPTRLDCVYSTLMPANWIACLRGRGLGLRIWQAGMARAGSRAIGLQIHGGRRLGPLRVTRQRSGRPPLISCSARTHCLDADKAEVNSHVS
jgi:hypothetical protein